MNITSTQNQKVKYWNNLKNKKFRDQEKKFLIEGDHLILEAQKLGLILETISIVNPDADYFVTKEIMQKISNQSSICYNAAVVKFIPEDTINGNIMILDGIQDPGNLGTIIRSGVAFNVKNIILSDTSVDLYNPKVVRATEGMLFHENVLRRNLIEIIPTLKNLGYHIIGTDVKCGIKLRDIPKDNIAIVIGSEGNGISDGIRELCDDFINIPISSECESLNAGVAASIIMYEVNHE